MTTGKAAVAGLLATLATIAPWPCAAVPLMNRASDGYAYFHRLGADMATHDAAVESCIGEAKQTQAYFLPRTGGVIGALVNGAQQSGMDRVQFAANLEDCMVARGWDVVRLDDPEGKQIAALTQTAQAAALAPWVGAAEPHGQIVRRYRPLDAMTWKFGFDDTPGPFSLSLTAGVHDLGDLETPVAERPANWRPLTNGEANTKVAPDASVIVIRAMTIAPAQYSWTLVRLDDQAAKSPDLPGLTFLSFASPTRLFWKWGSVLEKTYVVTVPPGHWRLQAVGATSTCLGGPAFDVGPGEAVFAGNFNAAAPFVPDPDMTAAKAELGDAVLAARLKPARWINGETFPCGVMRPVVVYVLELPNAPFAPGYAAGSHANPPAP